MSRPSKGDGAKNKLRLYFKSRVGEVINSYELQEVANFASEWARRVRELKGEEGMNIQTHKDRDDLKPGQYVLVDLKTIPAFERNVSKETRAIVLDRNGFTCQMCGMEAGKPNPYNQNQKTRLTIGHIIDKSMGGSDEIINLRAICSVCNEGASNITLNRPDVTKLLSINRRAPALDQLELLKWLAAKFPAQAIEIAQKAIQDRVKK